MIHTQLYRNPYVSGTQPGSHTDNSKELLDKYQSFDESYAGRVAARTE
ncbi:hypothetical protein O9929_08825 [Vibrio lentus]|nr:hypothetical protein [Vibrio lentus]